MTVLSILIPSYNHSKFIVETLNGHVEKNPFDYEIIVIDDGSTDNSVEVIKSWMVSHPEVKSKLISRPNKGITGTLNELIDLAQGKYIRIFGSDDISIPGANAMMVEYLETNQIDAVFGYCRVINEEGKEIAENSIIQLGQNPQDYSSDIKKSIITKWAIVGPSLMVKRDAFNTIGKFNEASLIEDWFLYMSLAAKTKLHFLQKEVAYYRHHQGNASRTKDPVRRVRNYNSQIQSGKDCLKFFSGKEAFFLQEAISLLELKKSFVARDVLKFPLYAIKYSFFRTINLFN